MQIKTFSFISKVLAVSLCVVMLVGCTDNKGSSGLEGSTRDSTSVSTVDIGDKEIVINETNVLNLNENEIISLAASADKIPEGYIDISGQTLQFTVNSAADEGEALENAKDRVHNERFSDSRTVPTGAVVIYKNDLYYLINVTWDHITEEKTTSYSGKTLCFKNQFVDYTAAMKHKGVEFSMTVKDTSKIKAYLDLYEYSNISEIAGCKILLTDVKEVAGGYEYCSYLLSTVYGDWGVKDVISLVKRTYYISAAGSVSFSGQQNLKTVSV